MRIHRIHLAFLAVYGISWCSAQDTLGPLPENPDILPLKGFILEYNQDVQGKAKRDEVLARNDIKIVKYFDSTIFSGVQIETDKLDLDTLTAMPGVLRAWPDQRVDLLKPVTKRETKVSAEDASKHHVHWATGVDKLHERGVFGKGVKVGIVDTGVWYRHSALGGGFGPGFKVAGGWDLVGDGWKIGAELKPDADPLDEQAHGTHVAGIIAGNSTETGWKGVAPEASLYSYKVFGTTGSTSESIMIAAFLQAFEDGMDVISASVGSAGGFADNPWAVVASRIAEEGVVVVLSAGNSGQSGAYFAGNVASSPLALSVASADVFKQNNNTGTIHPSRFTSWGGLYDLSVKPDIAAPGGKVFSTWPGGDNNKFALESGTSMAAPYVAGVAALYISKHGGRSVHGKGLARDLSMRILTSGTSIQWITGTNTPEGSFKAPTHQVGTGLINALKVVNNYISADLERFAMNDTRHPRRHQSVTIHNKGKTKLSFTFEVEASAGFEMLDEAGTDYLTEYPCIKMVDFMEPIEAEAGVELPGEFELSPGTSSQARFVFDFPKGLNATRLPAYGGKIIVKASNGESFSVPFQGLGFDLIEEMQNMFVGTYPWLKSHMPPVDSTEFTLDRSVATQDYPKMFSKMKWGSREIRYDIYERGFAERHWRYPPTVGELGYLGSATTWPYAAEVSQFNPVRHNYNETVSFPLKNVHRSGFVSGTWIQSYYWFGKMANGTYLSPGQYTVRFAILLPFSDPTRSSSWNIKTKDFTFLDYP